MIYWVYLGFAVIYLVSMVFHYEWNVLLRKFMFDFFMPCFLSKIMDDFTLKFLLTVSFFSFQNLVFFSRSSSVWTGFSPVVRDFCFPIVAHVGHGSIRKEQKRVTEPILRRRSVSERRCRRRRGRMKRRAVSCPHQSVIEWLIDDKQTKNNEVLQLLSLAWQRRQPVVAGTDHRTWPRSERFWTARRRGVPASTVHSGYRFEAKPNPLQEKKFKNYQKKKQRQHQETGSRRVSLRQTRFCPLIAAFISFFLFWSSFFFPFFFPTVLNSLLSIVRLLSDWVFLVFNVFFFISLEFGSQFRKFRYFHSNFSWCYLVLHHGFIFFRFWSFLFYPIFIGCWWISGFFGFIKSHFDSVLLCFTGFQGFFS